MHLAAKLSSISTVVHRAMRKFLKRGSHSPGGGGCVSWALERLVSGGTVKLLARGSGDESDVELRVGSAAGIDCAGECCLCAYG